VDYVTTPFTVIRATLTICTETRIMLAAYTIHISADSSKLA